MKLQLHKFENKETEKLKMGLNVTLFRRVSPPDC